MTQDRALKQAVRAHAREVGVKYTEARRAVLAAHTAAPRAEELERQIGNLLERGYTELSGLPEEGLRASLEALSARLPVHPSAPETSEGRFPFVVVVRRELVPADEMVTRVTRRDQAGFTVLEAEDLRRFAPIEEIELPRAEVYLLLDVDTGAATRNLAPNDALEAIRADGRSPLTVEEGLALVTHYPEAVAEGHGFSLLGSRCGDKRVTALWISKRRPKLGWCWAGNPHTWLGSASCAGRVGPA